MKLIKRRAKSEPTVVKTTIWFAGMLILAISSSHLNRCQRVLPRRALSVPSNILSVSCVVARFESSTAVGTDTNSASRFRTVPFFGPREQAHHRKSDQTGDDQSYERHRERRRQEAVHHRLSVGARWSSGSDGELRRVVCDGCETAEPVDADAHDNVLVRAGERAVTEQVLAREVRAEFL